MAIHRDSCEGLLAQTADTVAISDQIDCAYRLIMGDPFRVLVDATRDLEPDLAVVGSHRRNLLKDIFMGTTAERTIRESAAPVLMANGVPAGSYQRILIATDLSECSLEATRAARTLGFLEEAHITILHVLDTSEHMMAQRSVMPTDEATLGWGLIQIHAITAETRAIADRKFCARRS